MAPSLRLYNTLTRAKEEFRPLDPANVRMYVCGPTVYDYAHIGNARPIIVFDLLFRLLRHLYGPDHVTYVRNITDVDDKINGRAAERGISIRELTEGTARQFHEDIAALGVLPPTVEPRATEHIEEMKALIERLVASGHAYVAEEHVLFDVPSMPDYGSLSKRPLDEMEAGARIDVAPYKRSPLDFVLWKPSKPGDPAWPSPAGIATPGRPGWHIECSAMADKWLWTEARDELSETGLAHPHQFDIHAGGIDLVFPHHENEVAQSRCCFDTKAMANYWMHNGFLQVEGEKMAKSAGNFVTIRELLNDWSGDVIRLNMLKTHYRQPIDWTIRGLDESARIFDRWFKIRQEINKLVDGRFPTAVFPEPASPSNDLESGLLDDLNTPAALQAMHAAARRFEDKQDIRSGQELVANCWFLGFEMQELAIDAAVEAQVHKIIGDRTAARAAKNWAESDRLRDELAGMGIALKDNKDGTTTWEVAR
jgi:cysteinyl-tRNA synthetase